MHIALSKHHEARGGDRAQARETGDPHGGRLKRARQWLGANTHVEGRLVSASEGRFYLEERKT